MAISPQQLTIYLYSVHRAVIFAIAQLSCFSLKITANVVVVAVGTLNMRSQYSSTHEATQFLTYNYRTSTLSVKLFVTSHNNKHHTCSEMNEC